MKQLILKTILEGLGLGALLILVCAAGIGQRGGAKRNDSVDFLRDRGCHFLPFAPAPL